MDRPVPSGLRQRFRHKHVFTRICNRFSRSGGVSHAAFNNYMRSVGDHNPLTAWQESVPYITIDQVIRLSVRWELHRCLRQWRNDHEKVQVFELSEDARERPFGVRVAGENAPFGEQP